MWIGGRVAQVSNPESTGSTIIPVGSMHRIVNNYFEPNWRHRTYGRQTASNPARSLDLPIQTIGAPRANGYGFIRS